MGTAPLHPSGARPAAEPGSARQAYRAYRERQARRLVHSLAPGAVRPLYREAVAHFEQEGAVEDPLSLLVRYCDEVLIPLPPFEVWCADRKEHPDAHALEATDTREPDDPMPLELGGRTLTWDGTAWRASVRAYHDRTTWRGRIAFERADDGKVHLTAPVFCEPDPETLLERFESFDDAALAAFLRSTLP